LISALNAFSFSRSFSQPLCQLAPVPALARGASSLFPPCIGLLLLEALFALSVLGFGFALFLFVRPDAQPFA